MMHIINYIVKIFIIIMGFVFLSGVVVPPSGEASLYRVMGVVFILFGIYRIVIYKRKIKRNENETTADNGDSKE